MATRKTSSKKKTSVTKRTSAPAPATLPDDDLETRRFKAIVAVFGGTDLAELEYEDQQIALKLSRYPRSPPPSPPPPPAPPAARIAEPVPPAVAASAPTPAASSAGAEADHHVVKSPFVGTFYRAPSPDAPPFVDVGQRVSKGQTVCIIEAMKLMNEIPSDADGRIVEVVAQNGEPVQFGDPLFKVAKS